MQLHLLANIQLVPELQSQHDIVWYSIYLWPVSGTEPSQLFVPLQPSRYN